MNVCISYHVNILCHIMLFYMYIIIFTTSSKHITSSLQLSKYILETLSNNVSTRNLRGSLHTGIRTSIYSRDSNTYVTYHFTFPISIRSQVEQMLMILWKNWLRQCRQGVTKEFRTNLGSTISYQLGVASVSQLCGVTHNVILFMIIIHFRSSGRSGTSDFKPDSKPVVFRQVIPTTCVHCILVVQYAGLFLIFRAQFIQSHNHNIHHFHQPGVVHSWTQAGMRAIRMQKNEHVECVYGLPITLCTIVVITYSMPLPIQLTYPESYVSDLLGSPRFGLPHSDTLRMALSKAHCFSQGISSVYITNSIIIINPIQFSLTNLNGNY